MNRRLRDLVAHDLDTSRTRREVLGSATRGVIVGLGAVVLPGGISAAAQATPPSPMPSGPLTRPNVHNLDPDGPELTAYAKAVAKMKALPLTDPRNWLYQAFIHRFPPASFNITTVADLDAFLQQPNHAGWFTCEHHTDFFWPWHRMQLYWFEQIVRDLGEYPDFALPYWDYFDPAQRTLPESFRVPADASNPLWEPRRDPSLNSGSTPVLTPQAENSIFGNQCAGFTIQDFYLASQSLETTPHDWVHGWIGGDFANPPSPGVMSSPSTSAQDPIFWLHHANLDRLWESWLAAGHDNPPQTDVAWHDNDTNAIFGLGLSYRFFDKSGTEVTTFRVVKDVLDLSVLGYDYEELFDPVAAMCPAADEEPIGPATPSGAPAEVSATPEAIGSNAPDEEVSVGPEPAAVPVTIQQPEMATDAVTRGGMVILTLEGVHAHGVPGAVYEVYVNLPAGEEPDFRSVYFVGNIGLFGLQPWDDPLGHDGHPADRQFDISRTVATLASRDEWTGEMTVTIVPFYAPASGAAVTAGATPEAAASPAPLPEGPWVTVERITIEVR